MRHSKGRVTEIRLEAGRQTEAFITCPLGAIPNAGQYTLASDPDDCQASLGTPLFLAERSSNGFWASSPIPLLWRPGEQLDLVGPLGQGFDLPPQVQRLGLLALGETAARLMSLDQQTGSRQVGMTLFTDIPLPSLPASIEAYPISSVSEALDWPDFMALDLPLERLGELRAIFSLPEGAKLPFPAQALITTSMPCAGMARCGACAVPAHRGWKLACEDGPVFDLHTLKW